MIRILILTTNENFYKKLTKVFQESDLKTIIKLSKSEKGYISSLNKFNPGLIIVDQSNFTIDSVSAIKLKNEIVPSIPIIVIIKKSEIQNAESYLNAGAHDCITKSQIKFLPRMALPAVNQFKNDNVQADTIEVIKESEERFRSAFENSGVAKTITNFDGTIIKTNKAFCKMVGYSENELLKINILAITHPDDVDENLRIVKSLLKAPEQSKHFEKRYIHKNGNIIWASVSAIILHDKIKNYSYLTSEVQDITDKKYFLEALQKSEQKFHNAFMSIPDGISITRLSDGRILEVNDCFVDELGFSREEIIGKTTLELNLWVNPEDRIKYINSISRDGGVKNFEIIWRKKNRKFIPLLCAANLIVINGENYILSVAQDMTAKKLSEQKLIEAKEKAEEMNRLKASFLSNMSHELRTPMTGILGITEILKGEIKDPDILLLLNSLQNSGRRLNETLNLIMDLSQIESGRLEIERSNFNLNEIAAKAIEVHKHFASKKNIDLEIFVNKKDEYVNLDERIFSEIISNLVNNAIKYTKAGSVSVSIDLDSVKGNDLVIIKVKDTGIGISKNNLPYIFDEFRQASEGYNRLFEGSGLGLTVTKKLVEALNGSIYVESTEGKGTTFTVKLPI